MRKIIIVAPTLTKEYQEIVLSDTSVSLGTLTLGFDAHFFPSSINKDQDVYHAFEIIQNHNFTLLGDLFSFPHTIQSLINFNKELACYNIPLNNLPTETPYDLEIKQALELLSTPIKAVEDNLYYIAQGLTHAQLTYLKNNKAKEISDASWEMTPHNTSFKSGLNTRLELEGLIQHILRSNIEDPYVLVPNIKASLPYIQSILSRHNIPYTTENTTTKTKVHQYLALLDYYEAPTMKHIKAVIESQALSLQYPQHLIKYLDYYRVTKEQFKKDLKFTTDHSWLRDVYNVQSIIKDDHQVVKETLHQLESLDLESALIKILSIVKTSQSQDALPIQNYLQNVLKVITPKTLLIFKDVLSTLGNQTFNTPLFTLKEFSSLPLNPVENLFVLSVNARNYPNINAPTGILDTSYRKRVLNYPTQDTLNNYNLKASELIFRKSENLTLSVQDLNFEGRTQEVSNRVLDEAKNKNQSISPWIVSELNPFYSTTKALSPLIAKELYLKNKPLLSGSVSSFELYVKDPYRYFLERGLRVKQPFEYNILALLRGSINHEMMETGVINTPVDVLPQNDAYIPHFVRINNREIEKHIDFLQKETPPSMIPFARELEVESDTLLEGIAFKGYIDRIDVVKDSQTGEDYYVIIDYKSSDHMLSDLRLRRGEQLQLITYVLAFKEQMGPNSKILGSYYYSFNRKEVNAPSQKMYRYAKTKGLTLIEKLDETDLLKHYQLKGWSFDSISNRPIPEKLISDRTLNTLYDLDVIEAFMKDLYANIKSKILGGVLEIKHFDFPLEEVNFKQGGNHD